MYTIANYHKEVIKLADSMVIYFKELPQVHEFYSNNLTVQETKEYQDLQNEKDVARLLDNVKYYADICGIRNDANNNVYISLVETGSKEKLNKTLLKDYPVTCKELLKQEEYYEELKKAYPSDQNYIKGCLFPVDPMDLIEAKNGDILAYNKMFVEEQEFGLIQYLNQHINFMFHHYYNRSQVFIDNLYLASFIGVLYSYIPIWILTYRNSKIQTNEVHSFHLEQFFGSHMDIYKDTLKLSKWSRQWLYKNYKWLQKHVGQEKTLEKITENIFEHNGIGLGNVNVAKPFGDEEIESQEHKPPVTVTGSLNKKYELSAGNKDSIESIIKQEQQLIDQELNRTPDAIKDSYVNQVANDAITDKPADGVPSKVLDIASYKVYKASGIDRIQVAIDYWIYCCQHGLMGVYEEIKDDKINYIEPKIEYHEPNDNAVYTAPYKAGLLMLIKVMLWAIGKPDTKFDTLQYTQVLNGNVNRIEEILTKECFQDGYTIKLKRLLKQKFVEHPRRINSPYELGQFINNSMEYYAHLWRIDSNTENSVVSSNIKTYLDKLQIKDSWKISNKPMTVDEHLAAMEVDYRVIKEFNFVNSVFKLFKTFTDLFIDPYEEVTKDMKNFNRVLKSAISYSVHTLAEVSDENIVGLYYNHNSVINSMQGFTAHAEGYAFGHVWRLLTIFPDGNDWIATNGASNMFYPPGTYVKPICSLIGAAFPVRRELVAIEIKDPVPRAILYTPKVYTNSIVQGITTSGSIVHGAGNDLVDNSNVFSYELPAGYIVLVPEINLESLQTLPYSDRMVTIRELPFRVYGGEKNPEIVDKILYTIEHSYSKYSRMLASMYEHTMEGDPGFIGRDMGVGYVVGLKDSHLGESLGQYATGMVKPINQYLLNKVEDDLIFETIRYEFDGRGIMKLDSMQDYTIEQARAGMKHEERMTIWVKSQKHIVEPSQIVERYNRLSDLEKSPFILVEEISDHTRLIEYINAPINFEARYDPTVPIFNKGFNLIENTKVKIAEYEDPIQGFDTSDVKLDYILGSHELARVEDSFKRFMIGTGSQFRIDSTFVNESDVVTESGLVRMEDKALNLLDTPYGLEYKEVRDRLLRMDYSIEHYVMVHDVGHSLVRNEESVKINFLFSMEERELLSTLAPLEDVAVNTTLNRDITIGELIKKEEYKLVQLMETNTLQYVKEVHTRLESKLDTFRYETDFELEDFLRITTQNRGIEELESAYLVETDFATSTHTDVSMFFGGENVLNSKIVVIKDNNPVVFQKSENFNVSAMFENGSDVLNKTFNILEDLVSRPERLRMSPLYQVSELEAMKLYQYTGNLSDTIREVKSIQRDYIDGNLLFFMVYETEFTLLSDSLGRTRSTNEPPVYRVLIENERPIGIERYEDKEIGLLPVVGRYKVDIVNDYIRATTRAKDTLRIEMDYRQDTVMLHRGQRSIRAYDYDKAVTSLDTVLGYLAIGDRVELSEYMENMVIVGDILTRRGIEEEVARSTISYDPVSKDLIHTDSTIVLDAPIFGTFDTGPISSTEYAIDTLLHTEHVGGFSEVRDMNRMLFFPNQHYGLEAYKSFLKLENQDLIKTTVVNNIYRTAAHRNRALSPIGLLGERISLHQSGNGLSIQVDPTNMKRYMSKLTDDCQVISGFEDPTSSLIHTESRLTYIMSRGTSLREETRGIITTPVEMVYTGGHSHVRVDNVMENKRKVLEEKVIELSYGFVNVSQSLLKDMSINTLDHDMAHSLLDLQPGVTGSKEMEVSEAIENVVDVRDYGEKRTDLSGEKYGVSGRVDIETAGVAYNRNIIEDSRDVAVSGNEEGINVSTDDRVDLMSIPIKDVWINVNNLNKKQNIEVVKEIVQAEYGTETFGLLHNQLVNYNNFATSHFLTVPIGLGMSSGRYIDMESLDRYSGNRILVRDMLDRGVIEREDHVIMNYGTKIESESSIYAPIVGNVDIVDVQAHIDHNDLSLMIGRSQRGVLEQRELRDNVTVKNVVDISVHSVEEREMTVLHNVKVEGEMEIRVPRSNNYAIGALAHSDNPLPVIELIDKGDLLLDHDTLFLKYNKDQLEDLVNRHRELVEPEVEKTEEKRVSRLDDAVDMDAITDYEIETDDLGNIISISKKS